MKRILILCTTLPHYRKDFFTLLRTELAKQGIELVLIYGKPAVPSTLNENEVGFGWAKLIPYKLFRIGKNELIWQPCIKYLKEKDLVVVESANRLLINYFLIFARHFSFYKLAFWGHGRNLQIDIGDFRNRFKYLFINKCDWWFGYTNGTKEFLMDKKYPEKRITIFQNSIDTIGLRKNYNNIDANEINALKVQLKINSCITGIFCGAMYKGKNLDFILETCQRVKQKIPEFNMIFIGSGMDSFKVEEASKSHNWIHYVGPKFGIERVIYFKISLIQIMPYYVGLGILDSFAMETPIVTTSNPYHGPEIIYLNNGINGIMTKDNINDYSQAVIETLKTKKYLDLIKGCKLSAEKYTLESMVENFKNGIIECLSS